MHICTRISFAIAIASTQHNKNYIVFFHTHLQPTLDQRFFRCFFCILRFFPLFYFIAFFPVSCFSCVPIVQTINFVYLVIFFLVSFVSKVQWKAFQFENVSKLKIQCVTNNGKPSAFILNESKIVKRLSFLPKTILHRPESDLTFALALHGVMGDREKESQRVRAKCFGGKNTSKTEVLLTFLNYILCKTS